MPTVVICKKCGRPKDHHGRGLCEPCYQEEYRAQHQKEIVEYRKEYRADPAYKEQQRLNMQEYRKQHHE